MKTPRPYMNPYLAGFGLGLVLLTAYLVMGRGLGASGAVASFTSWIMSGLAPEHIAGNGFYQKYLDTARAPHPLKDWLVFEVVGVMIGGFLSGLFAHRARISMDRGPRISDRMRLVWAFLGGAFMAIGAQFARGCASGQALSGGAMLNLGSWMFMMCFFGGAYGLAWFMRRQWR